MKEEDRKYDELLSALRVTSPVLHQPEELTKDIIGRIESLPRKKNRYLLIGSWVSGLAAMFLLCLLIKETVFPLSLKERQIAIMQEMRMKPSAVPQVAASDKQTKKHLQTASFFPLQKGDKELPLSEVGRKISAFIRQQQDADAKKKLAIKIKLKQPSNKK